MTDTSTATTQGRVVTLSRDLFFGMRIRNALRQLHYHPELVASETAFADALATPAVLALVDFNTPVDWEAVAQVIASHPGVPLIAFGAHTDIEGFRRAKAAGSTRVIANGAFSQQLPDLVARHARTMERDG